MSTIDPPPPLLLLTCTPLRSDVRDEGTDAALSAIRLSKAVAGREAVALSAMHAALTASGARLLTGTRERS